MFLTHFVLKICFALSLMLIQLVCTGVHTHTISFPITQLEDKLELKATWKSRREKCFRFPGVGTKIEELYLETSEFCLLT